MHEKVRSPVAILPRWNGAKLASSQLLVLKVLCVAVAVVLNNEPCVARLARVDCGVDLLERLWSLP